MAARARAGAARHCQSCGVPLAADNTARLCGRCRREQRDQLGNAPARHNREFFETDAFRAALFLTRKARALAQGGDASSLTILSKVRSLFEDGVGSDDPAWAWWVDESELSWHEGMCRQDLGDSHNAVDQFERSVAAAPVSQIRSQYVHRAYLFEAQVNLRSWSAASATARDLIPLATEVASTRTVVLLHKVLRRLTDADSRAPSSFLHDAATLNSVLDYAPV